MLESKTFNSLENNGPWKTQTMQVFYILEKHNWKMFLMFPFIQQFASEWTEKTI